MMMVMVTISIVQEWQVKETLKAKCVNHKLGPMDAFSEDLGIRLTPHPFRNILSDPVFLDLLSSSRQDNQIQSQSAQC